jgi:hypothetical protein
MDIMRVQQLRNILMDLVKDGKHPDENTSQQIKLGGDAGINMVDGTADFTVIDNVSEQRYEIFLKPLPRWVVKSTATTSVVGNADSEDA